MKKKRKHTWGRKISKALTGRKLTNKHKLALRVPHIGAGIYKHKNGYKRPAFSKEWREKMKLAHLGKKHSTERKRKMSLAQGGTGISQRTSKRYYHQRDLKYMEWRSRVFERDNWTCQTCGLRGYVEPHHIKGWTKYPELRYVIENGITLCYDCHKLTRRKK